MSQGERPGSGGARAPRAEGRDGDGLRTVRAAWTAGRAEPDQRSEMSTQWICGEVLDVLGREPPWLRVRGPDGYESWVHRGGLAGGDDVDPGAWAEAATARSVGVRLAAPGEAGPGDSASRADPGPGRDGGPARVPRFLPWGARAARAGEGAVRLPGGEVVACEPADGVVDEETRGERFPPRAAAVAETALRWRGAPYLWGGRTRVGADCSGFVQAVYAMHGVTLPRDSAEQLAAGPPADGDGRPGDLLFFGEGRRRVTHVALVTGGTRVVHAAAANGGVAVDDLSGDAPLERRLRRRLVGATRPLASG